MHTVSLEELTTYISILPESLVMAQSWETTSTWRTGLSYIKNWVTLRTGIIGTELN